MSKQAFLYQQRGSQRFELHERRSPISTVFVFDFPNRSVLEGKMRGADFSLSDCNEVFNVLKSARLWRLPVDSDDVIDELTYGILPRDTFSSSYNFGL